jgi:hypothetical protein
LFSGCQLAVFRQQLILRFGMCGIDKDAFHRAYLDALGYVEVTDAFSAAIRGDFINRHAG